MQAATYNLTLPGLKAVRKIDANTRLGREYAPGAHAEAMVRQCAMAHLQSAITKSASKNLATRKSGREAAETFMRRIPHRSLATIRSWALPVVRRILCANY